MNGVKQWNEGPLVDNACQNENCAEHMVAVRYPATMEWIDHRNVVFSYFDLPMRCSTCGSLFPPANEGQLEEVEDNPIWRMRRESGNIKTTSKLEMFLYLLARDWTPTGTIDKIVDYEIPANGHFTNGWLAMWAQDVAKRLLSTDEKNMPSGISIYGPDQGSHG